MWDVLVSGLIFIFLVLVAFGAHRRESERRANLQIRIAQYEPEEIYWSDDYRSAFGISRTRQTVILLSKNYMGEYHFSKIASAEILKDGVTITNSNRGSQLAGAVVGGIAFGGIGALAGSLTGSSRSSGNTTSLELKMIVDCKESPVYIVNFFRTSSKTGVSKTNPALKAAIEKLDRCHAMVVNAMRNHQMSQSTSSQIVATSPAQLQQLWELKQAGALTEDEFNLAKRRLIEPT